MTPDYVHLHFSNGRCSNGKQNVYLRPNVKCSNKSRKVFYYNELEYREKVDKVVSKWFAPGIRLFIIGVFTIASNTPENALKEYWRICDKKDINVKTEVNEIKP